MTSLRRPSGLHAISMGLSANIADDHTTLDSGMVMYDALYTWCRERQEIHNWPPKSAGTVRKPSLGRRRDIADRRRVVPAHGVSFREAFWVWLRVAALSFGGPAGQIAVMHRILVEEKRWVSECRFLHALNYCMLLPGPEAQQLATYIGWLMHRTPGGIMAGGLFVVPGLVSIMGFSCIYAALRPCRLVAALFFGLKAAVLAVVLQAVVRVGSRALKNTSMVGIAAVGVRLHLLSRRAVPADHHRGRPHRLSRHPGGLPAFQVGGGHGAAGKGGSEADSLLGEDLPAHARPPSPEPGVPPSGASCGWRRSRRAPADARHRQHVQPDRPVLLQDGDGHLRRRLRRAGLRRAAGGRDTTTGCKPGEMLDGLGMAETTPGPLIMVLQFVGFMAAYRDPGALLPWWPARSAVCWRPG